MFSKGASFSEKTVFKVMNDIFARKNPDGTLVMISCQNTEDRFFRVTGVAVDIFESIDGKTAIGEIVNRVRTGYAVSPDQINADTEKFIVKLLDLKIVAVS